MFTQIRPFPPHSFLMEIRPKVGRSHAALSNKFLADPPTFLQIKLRLKGTNFVRKRPHPFGPQLEPLNQATRSSLAVPRLQLCLSDTYMYYEVVLLVVSV